METMGFIFGILGVVAFAWCFELKNKINRLERIIKNAGIVDREKESLKEILAKNLGKTAKLEMESEGDDFDLAMEQCILVDVDEEWLFIKTVKKEKEGMVRVDLIKGVKFI